MAHSEICAGFLVSDTDSKAEQGSDSDRPEVVGYYSLNDKREYVSNLSALNYCQLPEASEVPVDVDLNGIEPVCPMPYAPATEKLDRLLEWILANLCKLRARPEETRWITPDVVCYRDVLSTVWFTYCNTQQKWTIYACKWRGTVYLCAEEKKASVADTKFARRTSKFQQYMVSDRPRTPCNAHKSMNPGEFNCVFKSRVGKNSLLYGARIDAVSSKEILKDPVDWSEQKFVNLKTVEKRPLMTDPDESTLKKWWSETNLVSDEKILCGVVYPDGFLRELKTLTAAGMLESFEGVKPEAEMRYFCENFLNWIQSVVIEDYEQAVYKVEYRLDVGTLSTTGLGRLRLQKLSGESAFSLLPEWFMKEAKPPKHQ